MDCRRLVLISGPIASGKTSVARELARVSRTQGLPAAAIDMDDLVEMVAGSDWSLVQPQHRELAAGVASSIVQRLFDSGIVLIAVAGSTLSAYESEGVLQRVDPEPRTSHISLRVSLAESVRRAQSDHDRVKTKDADLVANLYSAIDWANVPRADIDLDTDRLTLKEVVKIVFAEIVAAP